MYSQDDVVKDLLQTIESQKQTHDALIKKLEDRDELNDTVGAMSVLVEEYQESEKAKDAEIEGLKGQRDGYKQIITKLEKKLAHQSLNPPLMVCPHCGNIYEKHEALKQKGK